MKDSLGLQTDTLTNLMRVHCQEQFPGAALSHNAAFWPMPSLDAGELSSSAAIEIARATKQRAEVIADRLIALLAAKVKAEWRNDRGYIVCWGMSPEVLLSEISADVHAALQRLGEGRGGLLRRVWCLVPDNTAPAYARVRLAARVALQALLSVVYEGRCLLRLHPGDESEVASIGGVVDVFRSCVERILAHEGEERIDPELPISTCGAPGSTCVWTTHHYHERFPQHLRAAFAKARQEQGIALLMPADGWLLSRDRALPEILHAGAIAKVVSQLDSRDAWYVFMLHAAGTVPSGDFDPAVALFEESASPLWNARVLLERYQRLWPDHSLPLDASTLEASLDLIPEPRDLVVRPLLLPGYTARAIARGDVAAWCEAFERVAQRGHAFMNTPETRRALASGAVYSNTGKIAAGLALGLSCILPLVVEEACEDQ